MSDQISPREYGQLEAQVKFLETAVLGMQADIKLMRDLMEQSKGGWRTLLFIGGAAASFGGFLSWILHNVSIK